MKLSTPRYTLCLIFQLALMFCDLIFNCASLFPRSRDGLLVLFIFQDLFLVLSITTMLMTFFSTYLFQAGLVEVLLRKFWWAGCASGAYAAASLALHAAWLAERWRAPADAGAGAGQHSPALLVLFTLQRCLCPWHYFVYKRAALRVTDPRLYEDVAWLAGHLRPARDTQTRHAADAGR